MADISTTPDEDADEARGVMSGKQSKPDSPRMLLDGRSLEEQKEILEDMNRVAIRHKITHSTAIGSNEKHVFTVVDFKNAQVGAKSLAGAKEGGKAKAGSHPKLERDIELARKFQQQKRAGIRFSDTHLMERIGRSEGLKRSAAIAAIKRGLAALPK
jgi:hypothetical protein